MTLARKNSEISITTEVYGALELIKNKILSNYDSLMDDEQIKEVAKKGYFNSEPMPYSFGFAPFGEVNQNIASKLHAGQRVNLNMDGKIVGHIDVEKVFKFNEGMRAKNIFLANEASSEKEINLGKYGISGKFELYNKSMQESKKALNELIAESGAKKISAVFLTADPFNRAHERIVRMTIDKADLVVVFLIRTSEERHINYEIRKQVLDYFNQNYLPTKKVFVFELKNTTLFSSHANPTLECIAASRLGANKLVIGQNHSGIGMFFEHNEAHTILDIYKNDLNLDIIVLPELVYCNKCKTLVSTKSCPHGQHHQIKYHPDVIKELLFNGIMPPAILVRPEISALVLSKLYVNRFKDIQKLCDDLFVNSGLLENKTDRDFYEELMKLYQTSSLT